MRRLTMSPRSDWPLLLAVLVLFVPGIVSFGPVFGSARGFIAATGGIVVGLGVTYVATWKRWSLTSTVAGLLIGYLVLGGPLALPQTTLFGLIPTPETLLRLVPLTVQSWRDLLTVTPPADAFIGPAVVPFLAGIITSALAVTLTWRLRHRLWTLLMPLVYLWIGILWGLGDTPTALPVGVAFGVLALGYSVWRAHVESRRADSEILGIVAQRRRASVGGFQAVGVLAFATAVAVLASPILARGDRHVLRDVVQPPLNLTEYASPLSGYRYFEVDQKEVTLFTVSGLGPQSRVRYATLDAYDGMVYNVADSSAGFVRIGDRVAMHGASGTPAQLSVTVNKYQGVWMPGGGAVRGVRFEGTRQKDQADSLYYNAWGGTLITTAGVGEGDRYVIDLLVDIVDRKAAANASVATVSAPAPEQVPEIVSKLALDYAADAATPLEQLERIESKLSKTGFYSDGSDGKSRAGHSSERIASMLNAPILIGDDEQYAVAMALMARSLGIPARVVMGFYPEGSTPETLAVKGTMAHVWVEVPFEGVGWVVFDPTPDRDRVPQTDQPKPKPQPKPQVISRPDPPPTQVDDPLDDPGIQDDAKDEGGWAMFLRILGVIMRVVGTAGVIAGPFVLIGWLKHARRQRRRTADDVTARFSGGWAEIEDLATDLGVAMPPSSTRRENAQLLTDRYPESDLYHVAGRIDQAVFGGEVPTVEEADATWMRVDSSRDTMLTQSGRWGRVRSFVSIKSLLGSVPTMKPHELLNSVLNRVHTAWTSLRKK